MYNTVKKNAEWVIWSKHFEYKKKKRIMFLKKYRKNIEIGINIYPTNKITIIKYK